MYKRYGRLYRGLLYLSKIIKGGEYKSLFDEIEIIIADGTQQVGLESFYQKSQELALGLLNDLKKTINIQYVLLPGASYLERLVWLSKRASGKYITMQGDEDVIAFDSIEKWLDELDNNPKISAITGQYLDCKGFEKLGSSLKFHLEEGWVYGVDIDQVCPKARILQFCLLASAGISSISYSIMRSSVFNNFASALEANYCKYTYIGMESLLNCFQLAAGLIKIKSMPYVLRDFTFIDHSSADQNQDWSNLAKDRDSFLLSLQLVNEVYPLFACEEEANDIYSSFMQLREFGLPLRKELQRVVLKSGHASLLSEAKERVKSSTMQALTESWKSTTKLCYAKKDLKSIGAVSFRFLARSIVSRILNFSKGSAI